MGQGPRIQRITTITAHGNKELTLGEMRQYVEAAQELPDDTPVMVQGGENQKDGVWWNLTIKQIF